MAARAQVSSGPSGRPAQGGRARSTGRTVAPPRYGVDLADSGRSAASRPAPTADVVITPTNDGAEREAEHIAETVTHMPAHTPAAAPPAAPAAGPQPGPGGGEAPSADRMQAAAAFAIRHAGAGEPVSPAILDRLEVGTGANLETARVHARKRHLYRIGRVADGRALMAHEAAHVAQGSNEVRRLDGATGTPARARTGGAATPRAPAAPAAAGPSRVAVAPLPAPPAPATPGAAAAPAPAAAAAAPAPAAQVSSAPAAEGGAAPELLMPEPPTGLSAADRERISDVQQAAGESAAAQENLPSAEQTTADARGAVDEPEAETTGRAEGGLVDALGERPAPSPEIEALCERIREAIRNRRPPDEQSLVRSNPTDEASAAGQQLQSSVSSDTERVQGEYNQMNEPQTGAAQQQGQALTSPRQAAGGPDIAAEGAVPDAVPDEDVSLDADVEANRTSLQ